MPEGLNVSDIYPENITCPKCSAELTIQADGMIECPSCGSRIISRTSTKTKITIDNLTKEIIELKRVPRCEYKTHREANMIIAGLKDRLEEQLEKAEAVIAAMDVEARTERIRDRANRHELKASRDTAKVLHAKVDASDNWKEIERGAAEFTRGKPPELLRKIDALTAEFAEMAQAKDIVKEAIVIVDEFIREPILSASSYHDILLQLQKTLRGQK